MGGRLGRQRSREPPPRCWWVSEESVRTFHFHEARDRNVGLSFSRETVWRINKEYKYNTTVFSAHPLNEGHTYWIKVEDFQYDFCSLGVTSCDPTDQRSVSNTRDLPNSWVILNHGCLYRDGGRVGDGPRINISCGDIIGVSWSPWCIQFHHNGRVVYTWGAGGDGCPWVGNHPPSRPLWAVFGLKCINRATTVDAFPAGRQLNEAMADGDWKTCGLMIKEGLCLFKKDYFKKTPLDWLCESALNTDTMPILGSLLAGQINDLSIPDISRMMNTFTDFNHRHQDPLLKDKLLYMISKYLPLDRLAWNDNMSLFGMLCLCRAGCSDDKMLATLYNIALESAEAFKSKIYAILYLTRPLYWSCDSHYHVGGLRNLSVADMRKHGFHCLAIPSLVHLCAFRIRSHCLKVTRHSSLCTVIDTLACTIPRRICDSLMLNPQFGGEWSDDQFMRTHNFIYGSAQHTETQLNSTISAHQTMPNLSRSLPPQMYDGVPPEVVHELVPLHELCLESLVTHDDPEPEVSGRRSFCQMVSDLSSSINVTKLNDDFPKQIDRLVHAIVAAALSGDRKYRWSCERFGSTTLGLKILNLDEFDYSLHVDTAKPLSYEISRSDSHYMTVRCEHVPLLKDAKQYLYQRLCVALSGLRLQGPQRHLGAVYLESLYPHTQGPGVCLKLAWRCEGGKHRHLVSIDITPTIVLRDHSLGDLWNCPSWLSEEPLLFLKLQLLDTKPVFVPYIDAQPATTSCSHVGVSTWKITFKYCDRITVRELNERTGGNVSCIVHLLKLLRYYVFPKVLKRSFHRGPGDAESECAESELVTSYTLMQVVYAEFRKYPKPESWEEPFLYQRVLSITDRLMADAVPSLYSGETLHILPVPPVHRPLLARCMTAIVDTLSDMVSKYKMAPMVEEGAGRVPGYAALNDNPCTAYVLLKSPVCVFHKVDVTHLLEHPEHVWPELFFDALENVYILRESVVDRRIAHFPFICRLFALLQQEVYQHTVMQPDAIYQHFCDYDAAMGQQEITTSD